MSLSMARKKAHPAGNSTKIRENIIAAALAVAAEEPWEFASPLSIAEKAGISLTELQSVFPSKQAIVTTIIDRLDSEVEAAFPTIDQSVSVRDRLFDVLMERIDLANQHRAAHISFFKSFGWARDGICGDITLMKKSMTRMADCAGMDTGGLFGPLRVTGLTLGYLWVLLTWMRDASPDLGRTMAELDKTLSRLEGAAEYMNL